MTGRGEERFLVPTSPQRQAAAAAASASSLSNAVDDAWWSVSVLLIDATSVVGG
jgi:hypothetical protein